MHSRRMILSLFAALWLVLSGTLSSSTALAAAPTVNMQRTQYLIGSPTKNLSSACQSRLIYLAAGNYRWATYMQIEHNVRRDIYLAAGTYRWESCLHPRDGFYDHYTTLWRSPYGAQNQIAYNNRFYVYLVSGNYFWGSELDPLF